MAPLPRRGTDGGASATSCVRGPDMHWGGKDRFSGDAPFDLDACLNFRATDSMRFDTNA